MGERENKIESEQGIRERERRRVIEGDTASKEWLRPSKEICTRRVCLVLATMSHGTLDYVDADVDITYRMVLYHGG